MRKSKEILVFKTTNASQSIKVEEETPADCEIDMCP